MVSTLPGKSSSLPTMLRCMTLTRRSFHNMESPKTSTTERKAILSICCCAQLPLRFAVFVLSLSWVITHTYLYNSIHNIYIYIYIFILIYVCFICICLHIPPSHSLSSYIHRCFRPVVDAASDRSWIGRRPRGLPALWVP